MAIDSKYFTLFTVNIPVTKATISRTLRAQSQKAHVPLIV